MKIKDMTCPKCGAVMNVDATRENAICDYCGYHIMITRNSIPKKMMQNDMDLVYERKRRTIIVATIMVAVIAFANLFFQASQEWKKPLVDPFAYIDVSFQGKDGDGKAIIDIKSGGDGINPNEILYITSPKNGLVEGDYIYISTTSEAYRLSEEGKEYLVEGLDKCLTNLDTLSNEELEIIHAKAESTLHMNLDMCKNANLFVDMEPVKILLFRDGKKGNTLYDVFEAHFLVDGVEETYYVVASFDDVFVRDEEQTSIDMGAGSYIGNYIHVQTGFWIYAYNSLTEAMADILTQETYMDYKELDL